MIDTKKQPEALSLADQLIDITRKSRTPSHERGVLNGAIQELRRLTAENDALKKDAEMLDKLRSNLHWDGDGYWLPDLCVKSRRHGQNDCMPPTKEEFDAAIHASKGEA